MNLSSSSSCGLLMLIVSGCACLIPLARPLVVHAETSGSPVERRTTPGGVEYGLWGKPLKSPAPTLFILAGDIEGTLGNTYFRQCGNDLAKRGCLCVSIDLPGHGKHSRDTETSGLRGWRQRVDQGEDFVAENNARLSEALDHLIESGLTDRHRVAACGTSRGGFLAIQFAAHDDRVKCAAGFAPVTDLAVLREFQGLEQDSLVKKLSLSNQADRLAGRPVWIVIGGQDERVGTERVVDFARRLTAASRDAGVDSAVELHVMAEPRGHTTPKGASAQAAEWVHRQLGGSEDKTASDPPERDLLFIDDHEVLYRSGTKRVFQPARVYPGNPVVREDRPWEMAIAWTSILRDPETGEYRLWYQAYAGGRDGRKTHKCVVCYAESDDGVAFRKPALGVHDFDGQREGLGLIEDTNIVLLGGGGYGDRYANSVLYEPQEPDTAKRYKMLYTDFSTDAEGREWPGFHAAFSPDGIHWTKSPRNPLNRTAYGGRGTQPPFRDEDVFAGKWDERKEFMRKSWRIPLSMSDAADVFFDPNRGVYAAYGKCWIQGPAGGLAWKHAMARVESRDFLAWSEPRIVASPDDEDEANTEFHTSPVFYHKGVYFCLNQILRARGETVGAKADLMHIELMISRDGLRWERPFRDEPFITGAGQAFSNGAIFTNATPVVLDDEMRFYYGGYNSGAIGGGSKLTDDSQQSGVGFATIALDRFAGIRPVARSAQSTLKKPLEDVGQITLKPRDLGGVREIRINADAGEGAVRVEILDEDGYRVRGFSKDDAVAITGDALDHNVTWKEHALDELPAGGYSIRLHLDNAEVFAMHLK